MLIPNFNTKRPRYFFERPLCFFSTVSVVWLGEDFDVSSHVAPGSPRTSGPPHGPLAAAQQFLVPNEIWATRELNTDKKYHCHCPFLGRSANYSSFHPKLHIFFASSTGWVGQILAFWLFMLLKWNFWHLCFSILFRSQIIVGANWNCMDIFSQVQFKTLWQLVQGLFHSFWERKFRRLFFWSQLFKGPR